MQVFRYSHYKNAATTINKSSMRYLQNVDKYLSKTMDKKVPKVLNETKYNVVIDPTIVTDKDKTFAELKAIIPTLEEVAYERLIKQVYKV